MSDALEVENIKAVFRFWFKVHDNHRLLRLNSGEIGVSQSDSSPATTAGTRDLRLLGERVWNVTSGDCALLPETQASLSEVPMCLVTTCIIFRCFYPSTRCSCTLRDRLVIAGISLTSSDTFGPVEIFPPEPGRGTLWTASSTQLW